MKFCVLHGVALFGVLLQATFAYKETVGWGRAFVDKAAPAWIEPRDPNPDAHIAWARRLAFNMGIYNLVLAIGLAWIVALAWPLVGDESLARSLGFFFAAWLIIAAAAAYHTQVHSAAKVQGLLGVLLLLASALSAPGWPLANLCKTF
jgi:uncharacterized membrane protein